MSKREKLAKIKDSNALSDLKDVSEKTDRKELFWIKGKRQELDVYRVPTKYLFFNIENGRYADKMVQLRADNPGVEIDPKKEKWKDKIWKMLKGEYPGTDRDIDPFKKLRSDLAGRLQLKPGVVLFDGGVLDGNRRLAALLDLQKTEPNPTRFEYLDAIILDPDVGPEDRWRIEAGVQIGRDEKHPYSPINELLKIQEGLNLLRGKQNPEKEISKVLYGISEEEIKKDILKIRLINEYLDFIGKPRAYNEIGDVVERFEEAVKTLEQARKQGTMPAEIQKLKLTHFAIIRDKLMDNWQMRKIRTSMGSGKTAKGRNEKAFKGLLGLGGDPQNLKKALSAKGINTALKISHQESVDSFLDQMDAQEKADKPLQLANNANTHLKQLLDTLEDGKIADNFESAQKFNSLPAVLDEIITVAKKCFEKAEKLRKKIRNPSDAKASRAKHLESKKI
ncbi:MAG: hypothetical protein QY316_13045 [Thermodesulfobacteriota bacterium]|nr:MAG: hypothetical protein QY316_13045 [Thermodesulfobacteriota bacterium]